MSFVDALGHDLRRSAERAVGRRRIRLRIVGAVTTLVLVIGGVAAASRLGADPSTIETVDRSDQVDPVAPSPDDPPTSGAGADDVDDGVGGGDPVPDSSSATTAPPDPSTDGSEDTETGSATTEPGGDDREGTGATGTTRPDDTEPDDPTSTTLGTAASETTDPSTGSTRTAQPTSCTGANQVVRHAGQALIDTGWLRGVGVDEQPREVTIGTGRIGIGGNFQFHIDHDPQVGRSEVMIITFDQPVCIGRISIGGQRFNDVAPGIGDVGYWVSYGVGGGLSGEGILARSTVAPGSSVEDGQSKVYDLSSGQPVSRIDLVAMPYGDADGNPDGGDHGGNSSSIGLEWIEVADVG